MERLNAHVGSMYTTLQEAPEIFQTVRVDFAPDVFNGVVHDFMLEFVKPFIRFQGIGENGGPGENVVPNLGLQRLLFRVLDNLYTDLATDALGSAFQDAHHRCFILATRAGNFLGPLVRVHIASLPADVRFVRFNLPGQLVPRSHTQRKPDSVIHEPRRLLGDFERPSNFATANAVLAVGDQPRCHQPLVQAQRGVFVNRSGLQGELALGMLVPALPAVLVCQKNYIGASASGAGDAIRPAPRYNVLAAVVWVREVFYCFLEAGGFGFHTSIVPDSARLVK